MTAQFGRPRVPPAFAFAPWNDAIFGSANVRRVASKLRALGVPSSVIWTEDWRGGDWNGDHYALKEEWDVDRTLYPDFEAVAQELHRQGFKWLVYFNSFVEQDSKAWPETAPNGWLIANADGSPYTFQDAKFQAASLLDLSNPAAVQWAAGKMLASIELGADGWMGDYGEWLPTDAALRGGPGLALHDRYPQLWQQAQRQALDGAFSQDGVERLSFVRSGWLGSPPLVDVFWPGDQRTAFNTDDGMPNVVPVGLGVALSGISTYGSDIAGYQNATNDPVTKELFFRWAELGAWSPVMRTHHGSYPKLNWSWEGDDETTQHWTRYAKLHMALAPYLRGLAQAAHDTGIAILRGLAVEFPSDDASWPVADEWMLGPGVLVAPVQTAGALGRTVHLPPSTWYPWPGGAPVLSAGSDVSASVALSEIAVFARAGTIVPTYPDGVQTLAREFSTVPGAASVGDDRVVYAFAGASGAFAEAPDVGLTYVLTSSGPGGVGVGAGPGATATWNGAQLAACASTPQAPCISTGPDGVSATVTGPGDLVVSTAAGAAIATLSAHGGNASRALTLVVRM
jgi:alpha-glucosidase